MVEQGRFRTDLYYRLRVFAIELPALRQRLEDVPILVEHFLKGMGRELNKQIRAVSSEAMKHLLSHSWPGNVRELQSAIKYALVHAVGETLTPECLPLNCRGEGGKSISTNGIRETFEPIACFTRSLLEQCDSDIYRLVHSEVDRVLLEQILNHVDGNQVQAARLLGISRSTLRARLDDLGLTLEKRVSPETGPTHQRPT